MCIFDHCQFETTNIIKMIKKIIINAYKYYNNQNILQKHISNIILY